MQPRTEIVICTYNRADGLDRCLGVLAGQRAAPSDWAVTVIDNNSTDPTPAVVERHLRLGRLPGLRRLFEATPGLTAARRRGVRDSRADWVAFVDDDCHLAPDWLTGLSRAIVERPDAGAIGGRVILDWERPPSPGLRRNGWLFAEQELGEAPLEVASLVGAGLVVNRSALAATGWIDAPLLSDRIGRGFASGGDVEISLRLRAADRRLWYEPAIRLHHMIDAGRQKTGKVLRLALGLGAGAALVSLLRTEDADTWLGEERATTAAERREHYGLLLNVERIRYDLADWFIRAAYLRGRRRQLAALAADPAMLRALAGACASP